MEGAACLGLRDGMARPGVRCAPKEGARLVVVLVIVFRCCTGSRIVARVTPRLPGRAMSDAALLTTCAATHSALDKGLHRARAQLFCFS